MKRTILLCCGFAILLFIFSFVWNDIIWDFLMSFLNNSNLLFVANEVNGMFLIALKLSLSIALMPLLLLLTWAAGNIILLRRRLFSVLTVILCISLAIAFNILRIQSHDIVITNLKEKITLPIESLRFEVAILAGTVVGCLVSYFIFKSKKIDIGLESSIAEIGGN